MNALEEFVARHEMIVLQFSAGKDSAACLKMLRPWIHKVVVLWGNAGDPYRETVEYMQKIRQSVPMFLEVMGAQRRFVVEQGYPADSVPFVGTPWGRAATRGSMSIVPVHQCCGENLWGPTFRVGQKTGATGIIRGEKRSDGLRSIGENGLVFAGQEYFYPLMDWTDNQVLEYLGDDVPASYARGMSSSLDCRSCTAYLDHNPGRIADLANCEPDAFAEIKPVLAWLRQQAAINLANLEVA